MSFIGNAPAAIPTSFQTVQADSFNGTGSAVNFTLSRQITNLYDIEVLVDNVQQSPYDGSYSVSGVTLTFSSAPSSGTNNIYVIYRDHPITSIAPVGNLNVDGDVSVSGTTKTNAIVDYSGGTTATINGYTPTASNMAGRNRIINGGMDVWQRGTSFTPSSVLYGADRFAAYSASAGAGDYARSTDVPSGSGFTYSAYFNNVDVRHPVELPVAGNAGVFVNGSTWTVSFWAKVASGTGSGAVGLGFADGSGAGNFGRWGSDQSYSLTTTWTRFTKTFTVSNTPVGSNACVLLYFGAVAGQYITGVQLEVGSSATEFEHRLYPQELALCQRYYEKLQGYVGVTYASSGTTGYVTWGFKQTKRATPTISFVGNGTVGGSYLDNAFAYISPGYVYFNPGSTASAEL